MSWTSIHSSSGTLPIKSNPLNPFVTWERYEHHEKKDRTLKDEFPRLVGAQYAMGDQWRNNSRKNEGMEPKQTNAQL